MEKGNKISIIVPCYNEKDRIGRCVDSLLRQSYSNIEIILVDDGSVDGTLDICQEYERADERVLLISKQHSGLVNSRKVGIQAATGKYILYVDGDDWIDDNFCEVLLQSACEANADIVVSGMIKEYFHRGVQYESYFPDGVYHKGELERTIYPQMMYTGEFFQMGIWPFLCAKLFVRSLLLPQQCKVEDNTEMLEDMVCTYPCLLKANCLVLNNSVFYHHDKVKIGLTNKKREDEFSQYQNIYRFLMREFRDSPWKKSLEFQLKAQLIRSLLYVRYGLLMSQDAEYLVPFSDVKRGEQIAIYGSGSFGRELIRYLSDSCFCKVSVWIDDLREAIELPEGVVVPFDKLEKNMSGKVVIAVTNAKDIYDIIDKLLRAGFEKKQLVYIQSESMNQFINKFQFG